jgi:hypothetical protein
MAQLVDPARSCQLRERRPARVRGEGGFTTQLGEGADITLDYWFE